MLGMTRTIMESLDMLAMTQTIMGSLDMLAMTQTIMGSLDMLGMTEINGIPRHARDDANNHGIPRHARNDAKSMGSLDTLGMTRTIMGSLDTLGDALAVRWMSENNVMTVQTRKKRGICQSSICLCSFVFTLDCSYAYQYSLKRRPEGFQAEPVPTLVPELYTSNVFT